MVYVRRDGALATWLGVFGNVILGLLPAFLILHIGNNELLVPLRFVSDDKARVGQGHTALCPRVGAKSVPVDLVGLDKVDNVVPFGVHWRVAGSGTNWRRRCICTVVIRWRDWRGL